MRVVEFSVCNLHLLESLMFDVFEMNQTECSKEYSSTWPIYYWSLELKWNVVGLFSLQKIWPHGEEYFQLISIDSSFDLNNSDSRNGAQIRTPRTPRGQSLPGLRWSPDADSESKFNSEKGGRCWSRCLRCTHCNSTASDSTNVAGKMIFQRFTQIRRIFSTKSVCNSFVQSPLNIKLHRFIIIRSFK